MNDGSASERYANYINCAFIVWLLFMYSFIFLQLKLEKKISFVIEVVFFCSLY